MRLKALPAPIRSEDWLPSADFSLAHWPCSTCLRKAALREGCDSESNGCLHTEQRFAPPDVIRCGESVVAGKLKFLPGVLHPPVLTSRAARAIKPSDQEMADLIRLRSEPPMVIDYERQQRPCRFRQPARGCSQSVRGTGKCLLAKAEYDQPPQALFGG